MKLAQGHTNRKERNRSAGFQRLTVPGSRYSRGRRRMARRDCSVLEQACMRLIYKMHITHLKKKKGYNSEPRYKIVALVKCAFKKKEGCYGPRSMSVAMMHKT